MAEGTLRLPEPIKETAQVPFAASAAPMPAYIAAAGAGKSLIGASVVIERCFETGCNALVVFPDYKQLHRVVVEQTYAPLLEPIAIRTEANRVFNERHQTIRFLNRLGDESIIFFASAEIPENLRGSEVGVAQLDEVCDIEPMVDEPAKSDTLVALATRVRQPLPKPYDNQIFASGTPSETKRRSVIDHWSYKLWGDPNRGIITLPRPDGSVREVDLKEYAPCWTENIYHFTEMAKKHHGITIRSEQATLLTEMTTAGDKAQARRELWGEWAPSGRQCIFQHEWFPRYDERPDIFGIGLSFDTAGTDKSYSSYTVGQAWGVGEGDNLYLLDQARDKLEYGFVKEAIRMMAARHHTKTLVIETRGVTGMAAAEDLEAEGFNLVRVSPVADKTQRASQAAWACQEGRVWLPSEKYARENGLTWLPEFERELFGAPFIGDWDQVDAFSQFVLSAEAGRLAARPAEPITVKVTYGRPLRRRVYAA